MSTFGTEMSDLATELVYDFSEEIGLSQFKYITGTSYNTVSGKHETVYNSEPAYMVFEDIQSSEVQNASYVSEHLQVTIAGNDLSKKPKTGDIIVMPDDTEHSIEFVTSDQYSASFVLHIERKILNG